MLDSSRSLVSNCTPFLFDISEYLTVAEWPISQARRCRAGDVHK